MAIAAHIDLNTLDSLSRTCRQARYSLLQYRTTLLAYTLRCANDEQTGSSRPTDACTRRSRSRRCARDLISPCRRCGIAICRNCAYKLPPRSRLLARYRRLCRACVDAPLASLTRLPLDPRLKLDLDILRDTVCQCDSGVGLHVCSPCGEVIRSEDHEYRQIWNWRLQYGAVLVGLGTGAGDNGCGGVICGRETDCCLARVYELEVDSDGQNALEGGTTASSLRPGYHYHEVQGIGGVIQRKLICNMRVGAFVSEWEDEMASKDEVLSREIRGEVRGWCGWCSRVIPVKQDWATGEKNLS